MTNNYLFKLTLSEIESYNSISIAKKDAEDEWKKANIDFKFILSKLERYKEKFKSFTGADTEIYNELIQENLHLQAEFDKFAVVFREMSDYNDEYELRDTCLDLKRELDKQFSQIEKIKIEKQTQRKRYIDAFNIYKSTLSKLNRSNREAELFDGADEETYNKLKQENSNLKTEFDKLVNVFGNMAGYKDSDSLIKLCNNFKDDLDKQLLQIENKRNSLNEKQLNSKEVMNLKNSNINSSNEGFDKTLKFLIGTACIALAIIIIIDLFTGI